MKPLMLVVVMMLLLLLLLLLLLRLLLLLLLLLLLRIERVERWIVIHGLVASGGRGRLIARPLVLLGALTGGRLPTGVGCVALPRCDVAVGHWRRGGRAVVTSGDGGVTSGSGAG